MDIGHNTHLGPVTERDRCDRGEDLCASNTLRSSEGFEQKTNLLDELVRVCLYRMSPYTTNAACTAGLFELDGRIVPYVLSGSVCACYSFSSCVPAFWMVLTTFTKD